MWTPLFLLVPLIVVFTGERQDKIIRQAQDRAISQSITGVWWELRLFGTSRASKLAASCHREGRTMDPTAHTAINQRISLGPLEVAFAIDGRLVEVQGEAFQNFSPDPHVTIEVQDVPRSWFSPTKPIGRYRVASITEGPSSIELGNCMAIDVVPDPWSPNEDTHAFHPSFSPCVVLNEDKPIAQIQFTVLNFVPRGSWLTWCLDSQPWVIHISPVGNLSDLEKALGESGGYGVTHRGSFQRDDGSTFTSGKAAELLLGLDHFLSFVSGAHCSINTATGYDNGGAEVWKRWGSSDVSRWRRHRSWNDWTIAGALPDLFDAFWSEFTASKDGLGRIINLYAESNSTGDLDVKVILCQAALETAAHYWFDKQRIRSKADWIAEALQCAQIPVTIPDSLKHLEELRNAKGWEHGPQCITKFRNPAAHVEIKSVAADLDPYHEISQLALWYIELLILWRLKYQGEYASRLEPVHRAGRTGLVPWSPNQQRPAESET